LRVEVYGSYFPPQAQNSPSPIVDYQKISLVAGGAVACYLPLRGPIELGACSGVEVGSMHGQGFGVLNPGGSDVPWVAGVATARASWTIVGGFGIALGVGVGVPFVRTQFVLDDYSSSAGTVFQPSPVVFRALLGPELRF
jgi:hypothetical protein